MQNDEGRMKANSTLPGNSAFRLHPSALSKAGWAVFLGMSWTWCIGMFLPVLLVHDYGVWAWVIFAVPNVVGAAAMGWVLGRERSRVMAEAHRSAIAVFSAITVAFQLFFAIWVFSLPTWREGQAYLIGVAGVAALAAMKKSAKLVSLAILLASIICVMGMFHRGEANFAVPAAAMSYSPADLPWLAPVCLLGFLLCPYLDTTFFRARQNLDDRQAKWAFSVGFGAIFGSAIVLSLFYASTVYPAIIAAGDGVGLRWIKLYWMLQLGLTIGLHLAGDDSQDRRAQQRTFEAVLVMGVAFAAVALAIRLGFAVPAEMIYRGFLGFYGLVFPAYVWLCIVPGRGRARPTWRALVVLALAIAIASPMFFLAFIGHRMFWAGPGVAVVLLSRLFVRKGAGELRGGRPIYGTAELGGCGVGSGVPPDTGGPPVPLCP
jgi:hypothetical protein